MRVRLRFQRSFTKSPCWYEIPETAMGLKVNKWCRILRRELNLRDQAPAGLELYLDNLILSPNGHVFSLIRDGEFLEVRSVKEEGTKKRKQSRTARDQGEGRQTKIRSIDPSHSSRTEESSGQNDLKSPLQDEKAHASHVNPSKMHSSNILR